MSVVENKNFASTIDDWVRSSQERMEAVFKESAQRVISLAANAVPIDTGFARASIQTSTEGFPAINPSAVPLKRRKADEDRGTVYPYDFGSVSAVITNAKLGQTIYAGWTAAYVLMLEYGHSAQAPQGFVRIAAAQWDRIVSEVTQEAKSRAS